MAKPYSWSYSKIAKFELCPHKFYREDILQDIKDDGNYGTSRGGVVHSLLEKYALLPQPDRRPYFAANEEEFIDLGIEEYIPKLNKLLELPADKIICEEKMAVDKDFKPVADYFDHRVRGRSGADLTLEFNDWRHVELVDYKTGKDYADKFCRQGKVLAAMKLCKTDWAETITVRFHNLDTDNIDYKWKYTRADLPELLGPLQAHVNEVNEARKAKLWTKRPNGLCKRFCPVTDCEHNGG